MSGTYLKALILLVSALFAGPPCLNELHKMDPTSIFAWRQDVIRSLREHNAPAALRIHPDGSVIPIVLVNKNTLRNPAVLELVKRTMAIGMDIQHNPNSPDIDHGYLRVSDDRLVDYGGHGARADRDSSQEVRYGSRELNDTGLVHRSVTDYITQYRKPSSPTLIELAYVATPQEIETALAFHNLRRAGIVRNVMESTVRYEAGMDPSRVPEWIRNRPRTMVGMEYAENCVSYCTGVQLGKEVDFMKWKIGELGVSPDTLLQDRRIQELTRLGARRLLEADWKDPRQLHPDMLNRPELHQLLDPALNGKPLTHSQRKDLIAYLVGIHLSTQYKATMERQGAQNVVGEDRNPYDHRPRAYSNRHPELDSQNPSSVAILVYSDWANAEELIRQGRFEYVGRAHGIYRGETSPSRYRQVPLNGDGR